MYPVVGHVFGQPIPSYLLFLAAGYAVAIGLCVRWAKHNDVEPRVIVDLGLLSVIAGVLGARLMHVLADGFFWDYVHLCTDPSKVLWKVTQAQCSAAQGAWDAAAAGCRPVQRDCFAWAAFWNGGLTLYGGLLAGFAACIALARKEGVPVLKTSDAASVAILVAVAIGRVGCHFAGCCFGKPADVQRVPWAVSFPPGSHASHQQFQANLLPSYLDASLPVHPTQFYEVVGCLLLAALVAALLKRKRWHGQILVLSGAGYALLRFVIEFFRADARGGVGAFSTSQWVGLALVLFFGGLGLSAARGSGRIQTMHRAGTPVLPRKDALHARQ